MTLFLKVKLKSLAAEAKIIRDLERRCARRHRGQLREHRIHPVRAATRNTLLAYGFLRGRPLATIEGKGTRTQPNWTEVRRMAIQYGCSQRHYYMGGVMKACAKCESDFAAWKEAKPAQGSESALVVEGGPLVG